MNGPSRTLTSLGLAAVIVGLTLTPAIQAGRGPELLRLEMMRAAGKIKEYLDSRPRDSRTVSVHPFVCPRNRLANGAVLGRLLEDALRAQGVEVKPRAAVGVAGTFRHLPDPMLGIVQVKIDIELEDGEQKAVFRQAITIHEPEVVTLLFPMPIKPDVPGKIPPRQADTVRAFVEGNRARASKDGKFAVEVWVVDNPSKSTKRTDYRQATMSLEDGLPYAEIRKDQAYAVKLVNDSDEDVAVALSVDGLSMFHFKQGKTAGKPHHIIVPKKASMLARGWFIDTEKTDLFVATDRDRGVWASQGISPGNVGTVTAQFHECTKVDKPKNDTESLLAGRGLSTGAGERVASKFVPVRNVTVGRLRESVPVLYNRAEK